MAGLSATSEREVVACAVAFVGLEGAPGLCGAPPTAPAVPRAARGAGCSRFIDRGPRPQPPAEERLALGQGAWSWCGSGRGGALGTKTRRRGRVPQASVPRRRVPRCPRMLLEPQPPRGPRLCTLGALCTPGQARVPERQFLGPALSELGGPGHFSAPSSVTAVSRVPRAAGPTATVGKSGIREWGE